MKKIEAIIRHYKLEEVKRALTDVGITGMTVSEVRGHGRQALPQPNETYAVTFLPKLKLEIVVSDKDLTGAIALISSVARTGNTGKVGDGKIFVTNLEEVIRIRTGETGEEAI